MQTQKMRDHAGMYVSLSFRNLGGGGGSSIGHREFHVSTSTAHRDYRDHDGDDFTFLLRNPEDGYKEPVAAHKIISHGQVRTGYPVVPGNTRSESSSIDSTSSRPSEVEDLLKAAPGTYCPRVPTPPSPVSAPAPAPADQGRQKNGLARRWWLEKLAPRAKRCYGKELESGDDAAGKKTTTKTKKNSSSASRGFSRDRKVAAAEETENMMKAKEDKQLVNHGKGVVGGEKAGKTGSRPSFFANKHHVAAWICTSAVNSGHAS